MMLRICAFSFLIVSVLNSASCIDLDIDKDCSTNEKCVDVKLAEIIERIDEEPRVPLFGGLEVIRTLEHEPVNMARSSDEGLVDKVLRYAATHQLSFNEEENSVGRGFNGDARSSRLKKMILPLLLALKLKMAIVLPIILSKIALIAIKGLFAGLFALFLSGVTAVKSLSESKNDHLTAIVPLQGLMHHGHGGHWGRVGQEAEASPGAGPYPGSQAPYQQSSGSYPQSSASYPGSLAPFPQSSQLYQQSSGPFQGQAGSFQASSGPFQAAAGFQTLDGPYQPTVDAFGTQYQAQQPAQ